jgi:sulfofructose kinase
MPRPARLDVVGVGLNATDTLISVPQLPPPGAKVEVRSINVLPGGQVATAMIACQRWGLRTRYIGKLGDDLAARVHMLAFTQAGVETQIITVPGCFSAQSFIVVDATGERTVFWSRDERLTLQPGELDRESIVNARALLIDGRDTAAATQAAQWARAAGVPVIVDLDEAYPNLESLLKNTDYLVVSRDFPAKITDLPDLRQALPTLQQRFGSRLTAATLGTGGVLAWDGRHFYYSCAYQVPVADTTGAGDVFRAGFIYGLLESWELRRTLNFSCAAAGLNCMAVGARGGIPTVDKITALVSGGVRYPPAYSPDAPDPLLQ